MVLLWEDKSVFVVDVGPKWSLFLLVMTFQLKDISLIHVEQESKELDVIQGKRNMVLQSWIVGYFLWSQWSRRKRTGS